MGGNLGMSVLSIVSFVVYVFLMFEYATLILHEAKKNRILFVIFAFVNALITHQFYVYSEYHWLFYICAVTVLAIEFKLVSKANYLQVLMGSSMFILHMSVVHIITIFITAYLCRVPIIDVMHNFDLRNIMSLITSLILIFMLYIVGVMLNKMEILTIANIKRLSMQKRYTPMLSIYALICIFSQTFFLALLSNEVIHIQQLFTMMSLSFLSLITFYYAFFYLINFTNMVLYKRYSDDATKEFDHLMEVKKQLEEKLERDEMTKLYNREFIIKVLEELCENNAIDFSVLFVDMNALKHVNDTYGHHEGDKMLIDISKIMLAAVRSNDFVARMGGDEFVIVLTNATPESVVQIVNRIKKNLAIRESALSIPLSASIGAVNVTDELRAEGVLSILSKADELMLTDKSYYYSATGGKRE